MIRIRGVASKCSAPFIQGRGCRDRSEKGSAPIAMATLPQTNMEPQDSSLYIEPYSSPHTLARIGLYLACASKREVGICLLGCPVGRGSRCSTVFSINKVKPLAH